MKQNPVILMVDDDEDDRKLFFEAAREVSESIHCMSAEDGEKALTMLHEEQALIPDYIFLDLNMPRVNGRQCLEEIKKTQRLKDIPVIIFTTTRREEDVVETKRLGAVDFLTKPVLFDDICKAISYVLSVDWKKN